MGSGRSGTSGTSGCSSTSGTSGNATWASTFTSSSPEPTARTFSNSYTLTDALNHR